MKQKISELINDTFIRHNAIYFFGSLIVAVVNYLYYPVLSHVLSIQSFGDLSTLISIVGQTGILLGIFGQIVSNNISHSKNTGEERAAVAQIYTTALLLLGTAALVIILLSGVLRTTLHFQSTYPLIVLGFLIILNIPATFQQATLTGSKNFFTTALISLLTALGRLLFAILLIYIGFGVTGAILGLALAQLCSFLYSYMKARSRFSLFFIQKPTWNVFKREIPYAFLILFSTGLITLLYNSDIIAVKYFFPSLAAGLYAGVSTIANILYFITASISGVLIPHITRLTPFKENNKTMLKALGLNILIGGSVLIVFMIFPTLIIRLMIGEKYLPFVQYLIPLSILIFLVSTTNLFVSFFISLRNYVIIPIALFCLVIYISLLSLFHTSIHAIILDYTTTTAISLLTLIVYYIYYSLQNYEKA